MMKYQGIRGKIISKRMWNQITFKMISMSLTTSVFSADWNVVVEGNTVFLESCHLFLAFITLFKAPAAMRDSIPNSY